MRGEEASASTRRADFKPQERDPGLKRGRGEHRLAEFLKRDDGKESRRGQWTEGSGTQEAREKGNRGERGRCNEVSPVRGYTCSASRGWRRHGRRLGGESAAGRAQEAWPVPPPGSGLWVSVEPARACTPVGESGGPASQSPCGAGAKARKSARARLARAGARGAAGARARARRQASWAVGPACDRWRRLVLIVTATVAPDTGGGSSGSGGVGVVDHPAAGAEDVAPGGGAAAELGVLR